MAGTREQARINGRKGGRPKGSVSAATLTKQAIRDRIQVLVAERLDGLVAAQVANAEGIKYLVKRDEDGKFQRIGQAGIDGEGVIEVWEKDPSVQAFTDLMNRAADKPKEQALEINLGITDVVLARLDAWKERK